MINYLDFVEDSVFWIGSLLLDIFLTVYLRQHPGSQPGFHIPVKAADASQARGKPLVEPKNSHQHQVVMATR